MHRITFSGIRDLKLGGGGRLSIIYGEDWVLSKPDGTEFSQEERDWISSTQDRLRISNAALGGVVVEGSHGVIIQENNSVSISSVGNIVNSVVGSIIQNGRRHDFATVPTYNFILSCPKIPENIELEGSVALDIDGSEMTPDGLFDCEISGSAIMNFREAQLREVNLDVSGRGNLNIRLADHAKKAESIRLYVTGNANTDLSACPSEKADLRVSGNAYVRLKTERVVGKISGNAVIKLHDKSLHSESLKKSGNASILYF